MCMIIRFKYECKESYEWKKGRVPQNTRQRKNEMKILEIRVFFSKVIL